MRQFLKIYLFFLLPILSGCKIEIFRGIDRYEAIAIKHIALLNKAFTIINDNRKADSVHIYSCSAENSYLFRPVIIYSEVCDIFKQCGIKEGVANIDGSTQLVFKRLMSNQGYGVRLTVDSSYNKDTVTRKYYLKKIPNSNIYIEAETDL